MASDAVYSYLKIKFSEQLEARLNELQPEEVINCTKGSMTAKNIAVVWIEKCEFIKIWWETMLSDGNEFEKHILNRSSYGNILYYLQEYYAVEFIKKSEWLKQNRGALQTEVTRYRKTARVLEN